MNIRETTKIARELEKLGFEVKKDKILWFAYRAYNGPLVYRDRENALCKLSLRFSVHFKADVNENGVGDGKKPAKALTYALGFCNHGTRRAYRHKEFYEYEHLKFYSYSRNLKTLISEFKNHLESIA